MRLQARFLIVLALLLAASCLTLLVQHEIEISRSQEVLRAELKQRKNDVNNIMDANGRLLSTFVADNSYWDELVNFVKNGNVEFARENLDTGIADFNLSADWVYKPNGTLLYSSSANDAFKAVDLNFPARFFNKLTTDKFAHFYVQSGGQVLEIRAATIVPTIDVEHDSTPQGFLLGGQLIDAHYLKDLSDLSQTSITLLPASASGGDITSRDSVSFSDPLFSWDGQIVGRLRSTSGVQVISGLDHTYQRELILLLIFMLVVAVIIVVSVWRFVLQPVDVISKCVKLKNPGLLMVLSRKKDEFGQLAQTITEFFHQKLQIEEAAVREAQLEELNREKATFLAVAAHELNGPVNNVRIFAEYLAFIIQRHATSAEISKFIGRIGHQSSKISVLIKDLKEASQGKQLIDFNIREFNFDDFLKEEIEQAAFTISQKLHFSGGTGQKIRSDPDRLGQVVYNLIRNASKYSPDADTINIKSSYQNGLITVEVEDFGLGISEADQSKIFQPFFRSASVSRNYPGLGLGLAISKQIVEQLGGRMSVQSTLGEGSRFGFTIPVNSHIPNRT
jgi:signal transduction histidine kinase